MSQANDSKIPAGLCQCGCGGATRFPPQTDIARGWIKNQPFRFIHGHNMRKSHLDAFVVDENGCWIWQGRLDQGYPKICINGRTIRVHRYYYEQRFGPLPDGYVPDHNCPGGANRTCINPDHMRPLTIEDNSRWSKTTRLDWEKVRAIREAAGIESQRVTAEKFSISRAHVSGIQRGVKWPEDQSPK
jgi:hypothetical protein